jgi:poly-gamma-glutamate capsule biosynthesis protein CapA/YwtB (metallophosphatase superfamily)
MSDSGEMFLAFTSNTYLEHPVSVFRDEDFLRCIELVKTADIFFANLEGAIIDGDEWPAYGSGMGWTGSYLGGPPWMVDELKAIGVSAVCAANNHVADFGELGILATMKHLRAGGLPFAGIGASLAEAAEPCYIQTPHGRVALICAADWGPREKMDLPVPWPAGYMPSDDGPWFTSRPGINLLRYESALQVDKQAMEDLKRISTALDWEKAKVMRLAGGGQGTQAMNMRSDQWELDTETRLHFMGRRFEESDTWGFKTLPYQEDLERVVKHVRAARRQADVVVVTLHDQVHGPEVHDYIKDTAYAAIDAGCDVFLCNGGTAKGIEIYKGKAILHGQEGYAFQNNQVKHIPPSLLERKGLDRNGSSADFYQARAEGGQRGVEASGIPHIFPEERQATIQGVMFDKDCNVKEVRAFPIEFVRNGPRRSMPSLLKPNSEGFQKALKRATALSERLGTRMQTRDSYGVVEVN